jgi:hypothetical protein
MKCSSGFVMPTRCQVNAAAASFARSVAVPGLAYAATGAVMASDPLCAYDPGAAIEPPVAHI